MIPRVWILPIRLRGTDQGGSGYLHDGRQDIRCNEAPQDELARQPPTLLLAVGDIIDSD